MDISPEQEILAGRLVPPVKRLRLDSDRFFSVADGCQIDVACPEDGAAALAGKMAADFWGVRARVAAKGEGAAPGAAEGYAIRISPGRVSVAARSAQGVRYAMRTLRQLAESERGVAKSSGAFLLPCVAIDDEPALPFRGIHLCFFPPPETTCAELERQIRLAAYYKFNHVVIEHWGTLRFPSHPEFSWPGLAIEPGELSRLVRLAKSLGITPVPQLNVFGHGSAARVSSGKHALLDFHPEFAPLFEPDGWCWCLANPEARHFLDDLVNDLLDIFENPPFFHLGCDEADGAGTCAICRRSDYAALLADHILHFGDLLKGRGARPMLWHDMLVGRGDPRWEGCTANGTDDSVRLLDRLPREFVVCDWNYAPPPGGGKPAWATLRHFAGRGFDTLACPWLEREGTLSLGRAAQGCGALGLLETTWHKSRGPNMDAEFLAGAWAAWNPGAPDARRSGGAYSFNAHVRDVNHDMGASAYEAFGTAPRQCGGGALHE